MSDTSTLRARVEAALDAVRPHLAVDGGNIEVVEIDADRNLKVKWIGACSHCSMSAMTMRAGIEEAVHNRVPEIKKIEAVNGVEVNGAYVAPDHEDELTQ